MTHIASIQLKKNREQLNAMYTKMTATAFLKENARLIDEYFLDSYAQSSVGPVLNDEGNPCAIVALGGYGRDEQCIHSDVDILILFDKKVPGKAEELVREIIYPLWDIGLDVGHATRSVDECLKLAAADLEVFTSLLSARFICGLSPLFTRLTSNINDRLIQSSKNKILGWIKTSCMERHRSFGDSSNLIEPHLKNGMGGLRDYHTMLWLGRIRSMIKQPEDFLQKGYLNKNEYAGLVDSLEFIWNVRNRLHMITGRKSDQLHFEHQAIIAKSFKFKKMDGQQPVERFMGVLHAKMEFIKQHHLMFLAELGQSRTVFFSKDLFKRSRVPGLSISKQMLNFVSDKVIQDNPELLSDIFSESARLRLPLSSAAKRKVVEYGDLIDGFRYSKTSTKSFERIMGTVSREFNVLNEMLSTGFLVRLIPEFGKISNRIQYNQYHIYPVDRHSIHVLQAVMEFSSKENMDKEPFYGKLYGEIASKKALHWASLFHDIGKGMPGGEHSREGAKIIRDILKKRDMNPKLIDTVAFLIEHHLYLINVAKRRDIDDEETVMACARTIKDADRLKMLYLLTVADSLSTGPNAWNTWTESLLRDLFFKVLEILETGDLVSNRKEKSIQIKKEKIFANDHTLIMGHDDLSDLIDSMSPRYLLSTPDKKIIEHIGLYEAKKEADFVLKVRKVHQANNRCAAICGNDKPGFFSKVAGVFTLNDFDILDAQIFSWGKHTALDLFTIKPFYDLTREEERWARVKNDLQRVLNDKLDLTEALRMKPASPLFKKTVRASGKADRVDIDNKSSSFFTIIEVYSYDFPGLLYSVTNALYTCNLDIVYAKIATHVEQVVDIFYVRSLYGGKVDQPEQIREIKKAVLTAVNQSGHPRVVETSMTF
ncbi:MAG: [protein-PII] uridylyltransferase [Proteobacteria bacterium]|nr:[protein-PII] uridylyltransferase [Pseudomonadota bacterium]